MHIVEVELQQGVKIFSVCVGVEIVVVRAASTI